MGGRPREVGSDMDEDANVSSVLTSLVEALEDDPFYVAITIDFSSDDDRRRAVLAAYFDYSMKEGERLGCCTVLPDDDRGVAIWTKPGHQRLLSESKHDKHRFLESMLGTDGLANYHRIIDFMSPRSERIVGTGTWYLSILGVSPSAQGRGIGRRLLEPTLDEVDRECAVCYLETYSPRSIPFYERLGFRRVVSHIEPVTSSEYWILVRGSIDGPGRRARVTPYPCEPECL